MFGIWCLTLLSSIFQGYRDGQFYLWKEPKNPKKTENMVENVVKDTYSIMYRLDISTTLTIIYHFRVAQI
jgi:hypothetical protein